MQGDGDILWVPSRARVEDTTLVAFSRGVLGGVPDYESLHRWSVDELDEFWDAVWSWFSVVGRRGNGPVREGEGMPVDGLRWFPSARLNYAENALRRAAEHPDRIAVIGIGDDESRVELTWAELVAQVSAAREGLRRLGVGPGDRVAAYVANRPEALVAMLATAALGAVWSSCSPDFGAESVIDRFAQIEPTVLLAVDGYRYRGREFSRSDELDRIRAALPSLVATVVIPVLGGDPPEGALPYAALTTLPGAEAPPLEFVRVPFDHPLWILYSSGTTGLPKPIVHGHGGMVLEHQKALGLHVDLHPGDVFLWYTTTGWMMWNFLVSGLLLGSTVILFDGAPTGDRLWRLAAEHRVTHLGVGAPYIMASRKAALTPGRDLDLGALRFVGSTGSPLAPEGFEWVYAEVSSDVLLGSLSGGTDVCSAFVGPVPVLPVRAGVLQGAALGAAVAAFDDAGDEVIGEVGELVLTEPLPCMPVSFWNDPGMRRYRAAYFDDFPGVWRHGDWITVLPDGGCIISGRSDATLNRGGIRMGTSDFYRVVEELPEIADSLIVDTGRIGQDGRLVLFVQAAPGAELGEAVRGRIRAVLRDRLSPHHVPDDIVEVRGIPRTLSGKKLEVPLRRVLLGADPAVAATAGALSNPATLSECVAAYRRIPPA